jgi:glucans biosynthesis protein C
MSADERINGFDALRAVAMWLGVILHTIIVYKAEAEPNWPHEPGSYNALNWVYSFIHIFRMPLFYMVAGFFSCMVIQKKGITDFLKQRAKRILIPFIAGVLLIVPLSLFPFSINHYYYEQHLGFMNAVQKSISEVFKWKGLAHLWFLYYLIIFYLISVLWVKTLNHIRLGKIKLLSPLTASVAALLLFIVFVAALLVYFNAGQPPVYTGIKPNPFFLFYYGGFFAFGWCMYLLKDIMQIVSKGGWLLCVAGILLLCIRMKAGETYTGAYIISGIETCFLVLGITGLFLRYFKTENKTWRYFSDASYWVYLMHLFIVVSVQVALLSLAIPLWIKLLFVLLSSFIITMFTYRKFVRKSIIGEYLHGKRYS